MKRRTRQQVGEILRGHRLSLGLRQEELEGVSSSTVRIWEKGGDGTATRSLTAAAYMRALEWPPDAIDRLLAGEDPDDWPDPAAAVTRTAALSGDLTSDEAKQVQAFIEGLRAGRGDHP